MKLPWSSSKAFYVFHKFRHKFLRPSFSHISGQTHANFSKTGTPRITVRSDQPPSSALQIHDSDSSAVRLERSSSVSFSDAFFFPQELIGCQSQLLSYLFLHVTIHLSSHPSITVPSHPQGMRKDLSQKKVRVIQTHTHTHTHTHTVLYFLWYKSL